jgi:hypothetical protein
MKTLLLSLLMVLTLLGPARGVAGDVAPAFQIVGLDDRPALATKLRDMAVDAHRELVARAGRDWQGTVLVCWVPESIFLEQTGFRPEHVAAAAAPSRMTIWINEAAWQRSPEAARRETLRHELAHLLLGTLPGGKDLPLWANEGITMHLAGQWSWDEHMRLVAAHFMGRLPTLLSLEQTFPRDEAAQALAYRMSYSAVRAVADSLGDAPGSVHRLVARLADPVRGPALAAEMRDPLRREDWQFATAHALGSRLATGILLVTGSSLLFVLLALLLVVGYFLKQRRTRDRFAEEQEDDRWAESLSDEDVQDIYGDREDRWKSGEDDEEARR